MQFFKITTIIFKWEYFLFELVYLKALGSEKLLSLVLLYVSAIWLTPMGISSAIAWVWYCLSLVRSNAINLVTLPWQLGKNKTRNANKVLELGAVRAPLPHGGGPQQVREGPGCISVVEMSREGVLWGPASCAVITLDPKLSLGVEKNVSQRIIWNKCFSELERVFCCYCLVSGWRTDSKNSQPNLSSQGTTELLCCMLTTFVALQGDTKAVFQTL